MLKKVSTKVVYSNQWIKIHEDKTISNDGQKGIYAYLESRDSCIIVPVNNKGQIFLVLAHRYPSNSYGWELPGGGGDNEELINASKRELKEETGITANSWINLGEAYVCDGLMTEKMAVYLAQDLKFDDNQKNIDESFEDMRFFSLKEISKMILNGEINDCQTLSALQYYNIWTQTKEEQ